MRAAEEAKRLEVGATTASEDNEEQNGQPTQLSSRLRQKKKYWERKRATQKDNRNRAAKRTAQLAATVSLPFSFPSSFRSQQSLFFQETSSASSPRSSSSTVSPAGDSRPGSPQSQSDAATGYLEDKSATASNSHSPSGALDEPSPSASERLMSAEDKNASDSEALSQKRNSRPRERGTGRRRWYGRR